MDFSNDSTHMNANYNPYAPPKASSSAERRSPRVKPRTVAWAVTALWVALGTTCVQLVIVLGDRWRSWPPEFLALQQMALMVLFAGLIYGVSRGRYWARLTYAVLLGVRTEHFIQSAPANWHDSHGLVLMTVLSFTCQYVAMYWLFTEPGRRWFARSRDTA